jgi:hypothetical protein
VLETVSLNAQTRGAVVKSGDEFTRCDAVWLVYTGFEKGASWETVWLQGKLLTSEEAGDAAIQWLAPMLFVDLYNDDGAWVRLRGRNGEAGWASATARTLMRLQPQDGSTKTLAARPAPVIAKARRLRLIRRAAAWPSMSRRTSTPRPFSRGGRCTIVWSAQGTRLVCGHRFRNPSLRAIPASFPAQVQASADPCGPRAGPRCTSMPDPGTRTPPGRLLAGRTDKADA